VGAVSDEVDRIAWETREMRAWMSDQRSGAEESSGLAVDGVVEPASGFLSLGVGRVAVGFSAGVVKAELRVCSDGVVKPADVFSTGGVPSVPAAPSGCALAGAAPADDGDDVSTLPRMIGKPSFPPPTITTFEFGECAS